MSGYMSAADMNALKSAIKTEMQRRTGYGALNGYAATTYDFTTTPATGKPVLTEQGQKTIDLLLKVKPYGDLKAVIKGDVIPANFSKGLIDYVKTLASNPMTSGTNDCAASCTGLCISQCSGTCKGCSGCGGCGGCSGCGSCDGGCYGGCDGCSGCGSGCSGCSGCGGSCGSGCGACTSCSSCGSDCSAV